MPVYATQESANQTTAAAAASGGGGGGSGGERSEYIPMSDWPLPPAAAAAAVAAVAAVAIGAGLMEYDPWVGVEAPLCTEVPVVAAADDIWGLGDEWWEREETPVPSSSSSLLWWWLTW